MILGCTGSAASAHIFWQRSVAAIALTLWSVIGFTQEPTPRA